MLTLIASVRPEIEPVLRRIHDMRALTVGRKAAWEGLLAGVPVLLIEGGMGKTNASHALTAAMETRSVRGVIGFGVAGAYAGSGLNVGDVALATAEVYGDEGVLAPGGWLSAEAIGIPLVRSPGGPIFNELPADPGRVEIAANALAAAAVEHRTGVFVTVSACSGTSARGTELAARFGAICESMEGAACAHVAAVYGVPWLELRGISNRVEDRDLSRWQIDRAAEACAGAVAAAVGGWG